MYPTRDINRGCGMCVARVFACQGVFVAPFDLKHGRLNFWFFKVEAVLLGEIFFPQPRAQRGCCLSCRARARPPPVYTLLWGRVGTCVRPRPHDRGEDAAEASRRCSQ